MSPKQRQAMIDLDQKQLSLVRQCTLLDISRGLVYYQPTPTRAGKSSTPTRSAWTARGATLDNIFVERLWRSVKYEKLYLKAYQTGTEARNGIDAYLDF